MKKIFKKLMGFMASKQGQGMVEYGLIIGLVAILLIGGLTLLKDDIAAIFTNITNAI